MKKHEARRSIMREWMALPTGKRPTEEQTQRIVNAFFFSMTIFAVAFAYFVLSERAQDHHHPPIHAPCWFPTLVSRAARAGLGSRHLGAGESWPMATTYRLGTSEPRHKQSDQILEMPPVGFLTYKSDWFPGSKS